MMPDADGAGALFVVATPIGNLGDMTHRAIKVLEEVDLIAAEDTRYSRRLLEHFGIRSKLVSLHQHNETSRSNMLLERLRAGMNIALISDAGTPLISDPGYRVVTLLRQAGIRVSPVPGPCALAAALSVAGLPSDSFTFCGFLPAKPAGRRKVLEGLAATPHTLVLYESPHRILELTEDLEAIFGADRRMVLARELTKTFETVLTGSTSEIVEQLRRDLNQQRGEFVVLVEAPVAESIGDSGDVLMILGKSLRPLVVQMLESTPVREVVRLLVELTGMPRNRIYDAVQQIKMDQEGRA